MTILKEWLADRGVFDEVSYGETELEIVSLNKKLLEYERQILTESLVESDWNQTKAAKGLKMSEQNFRYRMKNLGFRDQRMNKGSSNNSTNFIKEFHFLVRFLLHRYNIVDPNSCLCKKN